MISTCIICGIVETDPELHLVEDGVKHAIFRLELAFEGARHGWIRVICLEKRAEFAARHLLKGSKVVVLGNLTRGSWKSGKDTWWGEITLAAIYLQLVQWPLAGAGLLSMPTPGVPCTMDCLQPPAINCRQWVGRFWQ